MVGNWPVNLHVPEAFEDINGELKYDMEVFNN